MLKVLKDGETSQEIGTLDELAREGARRMIWAALDEEVEVYLARHRGLRDERGHALVVRNGRARPRQVTVGSGTIEVSAPRVNDRREGERFTSRILPPYMRRSPKVAEVLPILYLRGLSTGDFAPALKVLLGEDAAGLSAANITRLLGVWEAEYEAFHTRDLSEVDYVYVWVDGIHVNVRLGEQDRLCLLVMIGVRPDGTKELVTVELGYRESKESWAGALRDLKRRGMQAPVLAIGDGALGFWAAVRDVWPETGEQRDWVHRIGNVLDKLPKRLQAKAKKALREIMRAPTRTDAQDGIERFKEDYGAKYPKALDSLRRDEEAGSPVGVLRLPGRALEAHPHVEPHRVGVRDRAAAPAGNEGSRLARARVPDGLQAAEDGRGVVEAPQRCGAPAPRQGRRPVQRRRASRARRLQPGAAGHDGEGRRLIIPIHNS